MNPDEMEMPEVVTTKLNLKEFVLLKYPKNIINYLKTKITTFHCETYNRCKSETCENSNIKPNEKNKSTLLNSFYMIHEKLSSHLKYSEKLKTYKINPK